MTRDRWQEDPTAVREAERFFKFVGQYVISFQWLEGKIDDIFLLARGHNNRKQTFAWLAQQTNEKKIDAFRDAIFDGAHFAPVLVDGWEARVYSVTDRLHAERRRRNGVLHAQFLFDFLAIGAPIMRTHVRRKGGSVAFDSEDLSPERCHQIISEVALLAFDLNMICVQLRHACRAPASAN